MIDTGFIICLVGLALLGYLLGFAKVLKFFTGGIFGIIIAIIAAVMLGGSIQSIPFVAEFIRNVNQKAADAVSFLIYLKPGLVAYYVLLFLFVQVVRIIVIRIIKKILQSKNKLVQLFNRTLGAVFCVAFSFALLLMFLAFLQIIEQTQFAIDIFKKIDGSILMTLYKNNPISFLASIG